MRRKIQQAMAYIIAAAVLATAVLVIGLTYGMFKARVMDDLRGYARMLGVVLSEEAERDVLRRLGEESLRVTLIEPDGRVAYDNIADPQSMANHADRPEVLRAQRLGEGSDVRRSDTVACSMYYYAVRQEDGSVLRLAQEASSLWSMYLSAAPVILLLLAVMTGLCLLGARRLTARLLVPIEQMTAHLGDNGGTARYPELEPFMDMIKAQHEEILRSADMRVEFTANVSHELKTPLTSISGYAELIESGMAAGDQAKAFAGEIRKSANRLLTLINDIIRLSEMDAPMPDMRLEPVELSAIASGTLEQLAMSARRQGVTLQLDARPAVVSADRRMMEELIYNLCDNAIRYNVPGGSVRVEVKPVRDKAILCVQDTGIGISREHQAHVFERFYRVDKSRSKATGGTGLGLAIVKHIAAKHSAQLTLQSELGRGTTITVTFDRLVRN